MSKTTRPRLPFFRRKPKTLCPHCQEAIVMDEKDVQSLQFARMILDAVIRRNTLSEKPPVAPQEPSETFSGPYPKLRVIKGGGA